MLPHPVNDVKIIGRSANFESARDDIAAYRAWVISVSLVPLRRLIVLSKRDISHEVCFYCHKAPSLASPAGGSFKCKSWS